MYNIYIFHRVLRKVIGRGRQRRQIFFKPYMTMVICCLPLGKNRQKLDRKWCNIVSQRFINKKNTLLECFSYKIMFIT